MERSKLGLSELKRRSASLATSPLTPESTIKLLTFKKAFHALYPLKIEQTAAVLCSERGGRRAGQWERPVLLSVLIRSVRPWIVVVERDAGGQVRHRRQGALAVWREVGDERGGGLEDQHFLNILLVFQGIWNSFVTRLEAPQYSI